MKNKRKSKPARSGRSLWFLVKCFVKRLPREGYRSLTVTMLAFTLVFLINVMDGVKARQEVEYGRLRQHYKVVVEISDDSGAAEGLNIDEFYVRQFTDPDAVFSMAGYVKDVLLYRELDMTVGSLGLAGSLIGVSALAADINLDPDAAVHFFDGYDERIWLTEDNVCLVSENIREKNGGAVLRVAAKALYARSREKINTVEKEFIIAGTISGGMDGAVYCPFWTANALGRESDGSPFYSDRLSATLSDNGLMDDFRQAARRSFTPIGAVKFTLTVYDSLYFELLARVRQNIAFVEAIAPVLYLMSVCIGVVVSFLLTRRRIPEFAVMRSTGVNRRDLFFAALLEQGILCAAGAVLGSLLFAFTWGLVYWRQTIIFMICYMLGVSFSAVKAAGTDVLRILTRKE